MQEPILYKIVKPIIKLWFIPTYRPTFVNTKNIPNKGRVILAGTHSSNLDGFILGASTKRVVRYVAKDGLFKSKIGNWFFTSCGMIPVNRNIKDKTVMPAATRILNEDSLIGIFPEGTRNKKEELLPFKKGAVKMAIDTNSPIVPFAIIGEYKLFKKSVKIVFGDLYYPKTNDVIKENNILRDKVIKIIKESVDE